MKRQYWMRFFEADKGGGLGGAATDASTTDEDIFKSLGVEVDDLSEDSREKLKQVFATLQTESKTLKQTVAEKESLARKFQSEKDRYHAQVQALTGNAPEKKDDPESKIADLLAKKGISPEQAKLQAPIFSELFKEFAENLKAEIGQGFQPLVSSVISREAEHSFQQARMSDNTGRFNIPEVSQAVWNQVQQMAQGGQTVNAAIVDNLASMLYFEHLKSNPQANLQPVQNRNLNTGTFNFPGAGFVARPSNEGTKSVSPEVQRAMDATLNIWGVKPSKK